MIDNIDKKYTRKFDIIGKLRSNLAIIYLFSTVIMNYVFSY